MPASWFLAAGPGLDWADPYAAALLVGGLAVFAAIGALSHQADRAFSASLIYLAVGLASAAVIGLAGIDWLVPRQDAELIERLSELAVVIALFSTGLKLDRTLRPAAWGSVARLLAITMPLTIASVAAYGIWAMGLPLAGAILLASALAPTDPVLAGDIGVGPPGEEDESETRFAVTAEAGLNDGLAFPFVVLALFVSGRPGVSWLPEWVLVDVIYAVLAGVAIGAVGGYAIAALLLPLRDRRLVLPELDGWIPSRPSSSSTERPRLRARTASWPPSRRVSPSAATSATTRPIRGCTGAPRSSRSSASLPSSCCSEAL